MNKSRRGVRAISLGVIMIGLACLGFGRERSVWLGILGIVIILAGGALARSV